MTRWRCRLGQEAAVQVELALVGVSVWRAQAAQAVWVVWLEQVVRAALRVQVV